MGVSAPNSAGAGPTEAGPTGAGPTEAGPTEAGPTDGGPTQAGPSESRPSGAGPSEAGPTEAGPTEAGPTGAGPTGAGPTEAGQTEAGPTEAGSSGARAVNPPTAPPSGTEGNRTPVQTTVSRFVKSVPKLERKHSSGDLHSRLKTRKVLGVGATDNGDVHRSKISQVLGHNEHLYVRFPRGLLSWYLLVTCGLGLQGGLLVVSPGWAAHLRLLTASPADLPALSLVSRGYGVTLLGLSHLLYAVYCTSDKVIIRSGLGVLILTDVCAMGTQLIHLLQAGEWSRWSWLHIGLRGLSAGVSLLYLNLSRNYYSGARKSPTPAAVIDIDARKKSL